MFDIRVRVLCFVFVWGLVCGLTGERVHIHHTSFEVCICWWQNLIVQGWPCVGQDAEIQWLTNPADYTDWVDRTTSLSVSSMTLSFIFAYAKHPQFLFDNNHTKGSWSTRIWSSIARVPELGVVGCVATHVTWNLCVEYQGCGPWMKGKQSLCSSKHFATESYTRIKLDFEAIRGENQYGSRVRYSVGGWVGSGV